MIFSQQAIKGKIPEEYRAVNWTMVEGLSSDIGNVMLKDVTGFLWVGSNDGLCRFDGAKFKKYVPDQKKKGGINSGIGLAFTEDSLHNIWIGTAKGISRYDIKADTFTNFESDLRNPNKSIIPFWSTARNVYCLQSDFQIVRFNTYSFRKDTVLTLTSSDKVLKEILHLPYAFVDTANGLWMLTEGLDFKKWGLLQISRDGKRTHYEWPCYKNNIGHRHSAEAMKFDSKRNSIWINSGEGLLEFSLRDKKFRPIEAMNKLVKLKDYDRNVGIDIDIYGRVWFSSLNNGIFIYDPKTNHLSQPNSDSELQKKLGEHNLHIYCDRDGFVWTSYWMQRGIFGLLPFPASVKQYWGNAKFPDSISNGDINSINPASQGKVWIGTLDGINIFDPETGKFEVLREKDLYGIRGNRIAVHHVDTVRQKAWISAATGQHSWNNLYEMDVKTRVCKRISFRDGARQVDPFFIIPPFVLPHKNGVLVCKERHGVFEIKEDSLAADLVIPLNKTYSRTVLVEDSLLFIRNHDGKGNLPPNFNFAYRNGKWTKIVHLLDSLEWTSLIYDKKDQTYWVSSTSELTHYDIDFRKIKSYNLDERDDLHHGIIFKMVTDNSGNLWFVNSLEQIKMLNPSTSIFATLTESEGYQQQYFEWFSSATKDAFGNLYFGAQYLKRGKTGLYVIRPGRFASTATSSVYLRSIIINLNPFALSTGLNSVEQLSLKYFQNTISIETGIIDYYAKGKGQIRYKLAGPDKAEDWQYGPAYFTIRYEKLPPGSYRLIMQASNSVNEFNSPLKILQIKIVPAFWDTWWFRILAAIFIIDLLYMIIRGIMQRKFRLQLLQSEKETQLAEMRQRTAELQQQATELEMQALRAQMNPHFIFNSLNSINRFILQNNKVQASEYLTKFSKLVRLILQNSQASLISLESELESLELYLDLESVRFDHRFGYKISVPKDLDVEVLKVPPLIIQPYAENAIWHGLMHKEEKGRLDIEVSQENDQLFFKIADDGIGRKAASALSSKSATKHKSMGLKITADRIAMLQSSNGKESPVSFNDLVNPDGTAAGTEVIIKMPLLYD